MWEIEIGSFEIEGRLERDARRDFLLSVLRRGTLDLEEGYSCVDLRSVFRDWQASDLQRRGG